MPDGHDWRLNPIKRLHFEKLRPLCPVCRTAGRESPLEIGTVRKEREDAITEGVLVRSNTPCLSE